MMSVVRLAAGIVLAAALCSAASLSVDNSSGGVDVVVSTSARLSIEGHAPGGFLAERDLEVTRAGDNIRILVKPRQTPLDLSIQLPLGFSLEAKTTSGPISLAGMAHQVRLETDTGAIRLEAPLRGIRLTLDAQVEPPNFANPSRRDLHVSRIELADGRRIWRLRDRLPVGEVSYGAYRIKARAPQSVELANFDPPPGWPLRFHWEAEDELDRILDLSKAPDASASEALPSADALDDELIFRSDVRMVSLTLAVTTPDGRPVTDLEAAAFHVVEDGKEQRLAALQAGDAAFNLVVLLDMSGSASQDLAHLRTASQRIVEMARPGDRVAIYALSHGMFQVVSPLTSSREDLFAAIQNLPQISGGSPLYDAVTLAYAQELRQVPDERNALIVISDGLDNQISRNEAPSVVKFSRLKRAAEEIRAIIYPVFLLSGERFGRGMSEKAREQMAELAQASGGRLFPAESVADLDPVFPLIESELRSVYSLGYYPGDQEFDGAWRTVEVTVDKPEVRVRARPGYYAK